MKRRLFTALGVAALLGGVLFLRPPLNGQNGETWVQVYDQTAVSFGQADPTLTDSIVSDWNTGVITLNNQALMTDGFTGEYLQVLEVDSTGNYGYWIVQNILIEDPSVLAGDSETFLFGAPQTGPANGFNPIVYATRGPVPTGGAVNQRRRPGGGGNGPLPRPMVPVPVIPFVIRPGVTINPPNRPPTVAQVNPIDATQANTNNAPLTNQDSVKQQVAQCAPAAVANSLEYLKVNDGNQNVPSGQANSRVGALDGTMGRQAGRGTPSLNILQGKLKYINQKNLNLTVRHQGKFCPGLNDNNCQMGQITDGANGAVTSMPGRAGGVGAGGTANPTPAFITSELDAKEDVEICFSWVGPPAGAHCVQVTGYNWRNGYLSLTIIQDPNQGQAGNTGPQTPGAHMTITVGKTPDGKLWIKDWPGGPAQITQVITES
jgi:hypothetical protein